MSLVLSLVFRQLLLSSYVNIKFELAVKSLDDLANKPNIKINQLNIFKCDNDNTDLPLITKLKEKIPKEELHLNKTGFELLIFPEENDTQKFQTGQAVILCNTYSCSFYQLMNPHIKFVYSDDHRLFSFAPLQVRRSHSHALKIYKL